MKKKFKNVGISETSHQEARFLSNITDRAIGSLIEEYIDYLFNIGCTFSKANLEYSVDGNKVTIEVTGRNNLVVGERKESKQLLEEESKAKPILKVKFKDTKGKFVELKAK